MNYNSKGIPLSDLGAELFPCKVCEVESVLMFGWCSRCRDKDPVGFVDVNPMTSILRPQLKENGYLNIIGTPKQTLPIVKDTCGDLSGRFVGYACELCSAEVPDYCICLKRDE